MNKPLTRLLITLARLLARVTAKRNWELRILFTVLLTVLFLLILGLVWQKHPIFVCLGLLTWIVLFLLLGLVYVTALELLLVEELSVNSFLIQWKNLTRRSICPKRSRNLYALAQARVFHYQGKFEDSLEQMEVVDITMLAKNDRLRAHLLLISNKCFLGLPIDWEEAKRDLMFDKVPDYYHGRRAAYDLLVLEQPNDFFEKLPSFYQMDALYITFYRAVNAELKGDIKRATELFHQLAQSNHDLYIVEQARGRLSALETGVQNHY